MKPLNKDRAKDRIMGLFGAYKAAMPTDETFLNALGSGKLYELYVLSKLLEDLEQRGFDLLLVGNSIEFKSAPGFINVADPHFEVRKPGQKEPIFKIFVDIEFQTMGASRSVVEDESGYHELDIVVVTPHATGRPRHDEIALGIECKALAKFTKDVVRHALGIRRELSFFQNLLPSILSSALSREPILVPAYPPSEFWLAYIDPKGNNYKQSPLFFGIEFKHWQP